MVSVIIIIVLLATNLGIAGPKQFLLILPQFLNYFALIGYISGLTIITAIIGMFFGYLFGPLYLYIHKSILGRKKVYGIQEKSQPEKFTDTFSFELHLEKTN